MPNDPVVAVIPGDLHLTEPGRPNHHVALWMVDEVNHRIRPDFVQFLGDNVQDALEAQFQLFNALRNRLNVPHFALVGDHDVQNDPLALGFQKHVGETFGSLSMRGLRFLRLNTQEARPVGLSPGQIQWLRAEIDAAVAASEKIVIFQHNYPYQIWEDFDGPGIDDWRTIVQSRPITAIFAGHTHYGQVANDGRNVAVATRSIGDPEGGPPGYTLAYFHDNDLALTYRSITDRGPIALITHPRALRLATAPTHIVRGPDSIRVQTWSDQDLACVRARIDHHDWFELSSRHANRWDCPLPGDQLAKGEHALEVVAIDQTGQQGSHAITFLVDPTGRFTAVPGADPRVTETAFC